MSDRGEGPDVSRIDLGKCVAREFPAGEARPAAGELRVALGRRVYDEIRKHAAEDSEHEICGVLLGEVCRDGNGPFLHATDLIRGEHTASQGAQVTITHETWNHFHKIKDSKFADKQYLGWYHSHPDFGIFLSSMDLFIQENFFSAPHQVALVVDPIRGEEGLFSWKQGKPERADRFWVGREEHKYQPAPEPSREQVALREVEKKLDRLDLRLRELAGAQARGPEGGWLQTVLLLGILLLLAFTALGDYLRRGEEKNLDDIDKVRRQMLDIRVNRSSGNIDLEYVLPPQDFLVEQVSKNSGEKVLRFRLGPEGFTRYIQRQMAGEPPQTSPAGPPPGTGADRKPGAEGQGRP